MSTQLIKRLLNPRLPPLPVPVFSKRRFPGTKMVANNRWQMPTVTGRPLISEHHIIVGGASKAIWVRFLGHGMPELKKSNWNISPKRIEISWRKTPVPPCGDERALGMLRAVCSDRSQLIQPDHIDPIRTIDAVLVQMGVIKQDPSEVIR